MFVFFVFFVHKKKEVYLNDVQKNIKNCKKLQNTPLKIVKIAIFLKIAKKSRPLFSGGTGQWLHPLSAHLASTVRSVIKVTLDELISQTPD